MLIKKRLDYLLILFRLFKMDFPNYPNDYYSELKKFIKENNQFDTLEESLLHISCKFLYLSNRRFKFCQHFIKYCNEYFV